MAKIKLWFKKWQYNGRPIPLATENYRHGLTAAKQRGVIG